MKLVTAYCPLTTTGAGELVVQDAGGARFVADCKVNPAQLVGHETMKLLPECVMLKFSKPAVCTPAVRLLKPPVTEYCPPLIALLASGWPTVPVT